MIPLTITPNLEESPWTDLHDKIGEPGDLTRIGLLPGGMGSGDPSVALVIKMPDGTLVPAQTSWRLLRMAVKAMDASPIAPKLADRP